LPLSPCGTGVVGPDGCSLPVVNGETLPPIDAMPAMLAQILSPGVRGVVVAGMLAATMSVNSSYLLGWSAVISQDIILPLRSVLGKPPLDSKANPSQSDRQFLRKSLPDVLGPVLHSTGAVYLYLGITGTHLPGRRLFA
jgi:hypothetical protein